jgi:drug/metabolite transporter (DMT)-like permease
VDGKDAVSGKNTEIVVSSLCLAFVIVIWGTNWLVIKEAIQSVPPLLFTGIRLLGGALIIAVARFYLGYSFQLAHERKVAVFLVGLLQMAGGLGLSLIGLQYLDIGRSALIFYTMPLWLATIEWVLDGRRQSIRSIAALGCGLFGVALLAGNGGLATTLSGLAGVALLSVAAFSWALGTWLNKKIPANADVWSNTAFQLATSGAVVFVASLVFEPNFKWDRFPVLIGPVAFNCIVATGLAFVAWYRALSCISSQVASQSLVLIPVVALGAAVLLQQEQLTGRILVACMLIVLGVTITIWHTEDRTVRRTGVCVRPSARL